MAIPTITLNNGVTMPALGFGVFQAAPEETAAAVAEALQVGTRSTRSTPECAAAPSRRRAAHDPRAADHRIKMRLLMML